MTTVTRAASDNLIAAAATSAPAIGQAAALARYWFLAQLGHELGATAGEDHPYAQWISAYASESYQRRAHDAIARVEETIAKLPSIAAQAKQAFAVAGRYTVDFFEQADRAWVIVDH